MRADDNICIFIVTVYQRLIHGPNRFANTTYERMYVWTYGCSSSDIVKNMFYDSAWNANESHLDNCLRCDKVVLCQLED